MTDLNAVTLVGRIVRDVEAKTLPSGASVAEFSIASNYSVKRGEQWEEAASFFDCVMFGKRAEALAKYLVKGKQIGISGELRQERWEKDGQKHSRVKVHVSDIQLLGGRSDGGQATGAATSGAKSGDDEDSIPF